MYCNVMYISCVKYYTISAKIRINVLHGVEFNQNNSIYLLIKVE